MKTRNSLLLAALLLLSACATTSSPVLPQRPVRPPTCPTESFRACPAPIMTPGASLGQTEADDVENRARWATCIARHSAWLRCARTLIDAGFLSPPEHQQQ